jgi:uncharacterized protein with NRDE domain
MCTVVIEWQPGSSEPLAIGANRDENPTRPSTHFNWRNDGRALYPLDVRGGTWIGANVYGVVVAITNTDGTKHFQSRKSRGMLVTKALEFKSVSDICDWANLIRSDEYNGFNLILIDKEQAVVYTGDTVTVGIQKTIFEPGLHVITGFGIDTWKIRRCSRIEAELEDALFLNTDFVLKKIMSIHDTGSVDTDVCIHDPNESHVTVSSCVITADTFWSFHVQAINAPPCSREQWDKWTVINEEILLNQIL